MKSQILWKRMGAILFTVILGISCMPASALARGNIDTRREASLCVYFGEDGVGFPQVSFSIYRVADGSETGVYRLTDDFEKYPVSLENLDSSGWRALAQTIAAYAVRDKLSPLLTQKTGQDGRSRFTGLTAGLYLVTGGQYASGSTVYTPEPVLVSLPGLTADDAWSYDVEVVCKFDRKDTPVGSISRKVQKIWNDDGNEDQRPKEISVQLLENGRIVDAVTLNRENNWEYTWENLRSDSKWQIAETEVPDGYTVAVTQERWGFVMTNTRLSEPPPKLPQTGMLWWPVPLLASGGLLLIVIGLIVRRRQGAPNEKAR